MKKIAVSFCVLALVTACNNGTDDTNNMQGDTSVSASTAAAPADTAQARRDLTTILDSMHRSFTRRDVSYIDRYMAQDGLFMGTDPGEILNFSELRAYQEKMFKDTTFNVTLNVRERIIRIHGASANLVEQYSAPGVSQKLMLRNVAHARYENGRWVIDMLTYNVIPKNEDFPKIDRAL